MIDPSDELICLGHDEDIHARQGAIMPPIVQASLFARERFQDLLEGLAAEHENSVYSRGINPTVAALETKLAALERGEVAKCFASGMGAVSAVLCGLLKAGDHILFVNHIYGPALQLASHLQRFGITHSCVTQGDLERVEASLQPNTRMIYFESPSTMLFRQLDITALTSLARSKEILTVTDNTWATPLLQKPLTMGVDFVLHSCSKYIGGHSDVVGGVLVGPKELMRQIFFNAFLLNGAAPAAFDAYLLLRGLRTLPVRLRQHGADALTLAQWLAEQPAVAAVHHPQLIEEDQTFTSKQLKGASGLFSISLRDDSFHSIQRFIDGLKLFRTGVSWGGVESLVISPNRGDNREALIRGGYHPGLVRLSIGLEGVEALKGDLANALGGLAP